MLTGTDSRLPASCVTVYSTGRGSEVPGTPREMSLDSFLTRNSVGCHVGPEDRARSTFQLKSTARPSNFDDPKIGTSVSESHSGYLSVVIPRTTSSQIKNF
jgi:hypothetical protein